MSNILPYIILIFAVALGTAANSFAKSAQGFTLFVPSIMTAVTIVGCMYTLSLVMKTIPVGITYASFAGLCIIATIVIGIIKFNQMPNFEDFALENNVIFTKNLSAIKRGVFKLKDLKDIELVWNAIQLNPNVLSVELDLLDPSVQPN